MPSPAFPVYPNVHCNLPDAVLVCGRIVLDPATPTIAAGKGFSVSKAGTGLYRVTLAKRQGHMVQCVALYHAPAAVAEFLDSELVTDANQYVTFRTKNGAGAASDFTAGREISFMLLVMTTKLPIK